MDSQGTPPVGLHIEENGDLWMVDEEALLYRFSAEGDLLEERGSQLQLVAYRPLSQVVMGPGIGLLGNDQFFLLAPGRPDHQVFGRTRLPTGAFSGQFTFDEGVGLEDGHTLNPVAFAFDPFRTRLMVLESRGRLQVFDAATKAERRYITKWGRLGTGKGEFSVSSPISVGVVVDSAGRVYVADTVDRDVRIQVFRP